MNVLHIEHIGISVNNLETSIPYYETILGLKCYTIEEVADQKVKTAFFKIGYTKIELLESTNPEGLIEKYLENKGLGIHHIPFAVNDVNDALTELKSNGIRLIDKQGRKGAVGLTIGFCIPNQLLES